MQINSAEGTETVDARHHAVLSVKTGTGWKASAVDKISLLQPVICDSLYTVYEACSTVD